MARATSEAQARNARTVATAAAIEASVHNSLAADAGPAPVMIARDLKVAAKAARAWRTDARAIRADPGRLTAKLGVKT